MEDELVKAIDQLRDNQREIESYREALNENHKWIDNITKDLDIIDLGNNTTCSQKLSIVQILNNNFSSQHPQRMAAIDHQKTVVVRLISNLDSQQVEEQVKGLYRRFNDLSKRILRKLDTLEATKNNVDSFENNMSEIHEWIKANLLLVSTIPKSQSNCEMELNNLKHKLRETEDKQILVSTLERHLTEFQNDLEPIEIMKIKNEMHVIALDSHRLRDSLRNAILSYNKHLEEEKKLNEKISQISEQLNNANNEILIECPNEIPLPVVKVEESLSALQKHESNLQNLRDIIYIDLQESSFSMELSPKVAAQIENLKKEFENCKVTVINRTKALNEALPIRKKYKDDLNALGLLITATQEEIIQPFRPADIHVMEDKLRKYEMCLNNLIEKSAMLTSLKDLANDMQSTLNLEDREALSTNLTLMMNQFNKALDDVRDHTELAKRTIKEYQSDKAKLLECQQYIDLQKAELKNLNRPIGNRIEDVKVMLNSYETVLGNLRDSKLTISGVINENIPELEAVKLQHDEMINAIENQLSRLKQLLLLREQFVGNINEIVALIEQCNDDINNTDGTEKTNADVKLNQLVQILNKIQNAEALLVAASDKGNKIGSEGSVADKNAITDLLQSLKSQIQVARKKVDHQKQKLEDLIQEHKKLINELCNLIDELQNKEMDIKSHPVLSLEPALVEQDILKHCTNKKIIERDLDELRKICQRCGNGINLPTILADKLTQARLLLQSVPRDISELEKYCNDQQHYRFEFVDDATKINRWIEGAENKIRNNNRHNADSISDEIRSHKAYFNGSEDAIEKSIERLENFANKIYPSLTNDDQQKQNLHIREIKAKVDDVKRLANDELLKLEEYNRLYQEAMELYGSLKRFQDSLMPLKDTIENINSLQEARQKIGELLNSLQVSTYI